MRVKYVVEGRCTFFWSAIEAIGRCVVRLLDGVTAQTGTWKFGGKQKEALASPALISNHTRQRRGNRRVRLTMRLVGLWRDFCDVRHATLAH
jgi:hypothetical protein